MVKFDILELIKSGFPCIAINTFEYEKARNLMSDVAKKLSLDIYFWNVVDGVKGLINGTDYKSPLYLMTWMDDLENSIIVADNMHLFFEEPEIIQKIINGYELWKRKGVSLVIIVPTINFPKEIKNYIFVYELSLPDEKEIEDIHNYFVEEYKEYGVKLDKDAIKASKGLTSYQIENIIALSIVKYAGKINSELIKEMKKCIIGSTGYMQFWEPVDIGEVGGLNNLKNFIKNRIPSLKNGNNLAKLKGILLIGIPGTGKSLSAKAIASLLNWPLLKFDLSAVKGSLVGESEAKIREATAIADSIGEVVIWIDEIEKGLSGVRSSGETEGGVTANIFAHLLTWLQETKSPILIIATANDISSLPPEFLRAGRFDAIFFVDLPNKEERKEIFDIMLKKYNYKISNDILEELIKKTEGWSGSEIEQLIKDAIYDGIETAYKNIIPLSIVQKEKILELREFAATRARLANSTKIEEKNNIRKIKRIGGE